jgi:predicted metal-dependent peptidase
MKELVIKAVELTKEEEARALKDMQKARIDLLTQYSFFGILALKLILKRDYSIQTMATDGTYLMYNPNFVLELEEEKFKQITFAVVHEIMHCALGHMWRRDGRMMKKWNYACDYAIHSILKYENNLAIEMPNWVLYDKKFDNKSAEEIYTLLPDDVGNDGSGMGTLDDHSVWESSESQNSASNGELENDWESSVINAARQVMQMGEKAKGNIPGAMKRYIDELVNPVKDWRILLREFIEPEPDDYTFTKPDYRIDYDEFGCFLPSFDEEIEKLDKIMFWIDTSGSVSTDELTKIYSEVAGAVQQFDVFNGFLGFFDSEAYEPKPFTDITSLKEITPQGGGGTDFEAPFNYVKDNEKFAGNVKCQIILTDGYCSFPDEKIAGGVPVLWLITTKDMVEKVPFGKAIYLPLTNE